MFEVRRLLRDSVLIPVATFFIGAVISAVLVLLLTESEERKVISQKENAQKKLQTCQQILASKDSRVATDLMKMTAQINAITKRLKAMASLLHRDAEIVNEVKWFVQYSKRLEQQGMVGCTYRRTRKGKLKKCEPKFNISDCFRDIHRTDGFYYSCPVPKGSVVKRRKKRRRKR